MNQLNYTNFETGRKFDLGYVSVSEQEIIDFAFFFDPLDFHTDKEAAKESIFGRLVASGPHIFKVFHITKWLPLFKESILAGLELKWRFLKPIFADMKVFGYAEILEIKPNPEKKHAVIKWHFDFKDENGELLQTIDMAVLHKMER